MKFPFATLMAITALASTLAAADSNKALLQALVSNGYLTEEQAMEIQKGSGISVTPKSSNVQELRIRGRIDGQFAYSDGRGAGTYSTMEVRRARLGVEGRMFEDFKFRVEMNALPQDVNMRAAFVTWDKFDPARVTFGYDKPRFGLEENTSSGEIKAVERSLIGNRLVPGERTGLRVHGDLGLFQYYTGIYNQTENGAAHASGKDDFLYNLSGELKLDDLGELLTKLRFRADWLGKESDPTGYDFDNAYAVSVTAGAGLAEVRAEYFWAEDFNGDDTRGWYVMPTVFVIPGKLELVGRYERSRSDSTAVLRHNRYAIQVPGLSVSGAGDKYEAMYFGGTYYILGNDLKYMMGVELAKLKDTVVDAQSETVTGYSALRMQF